MSLIPFTRLRLSLADGWEKLHKRGTVIAGAAFTALAGAGPLISQAWSGMPHELRDVIPQNVQQWIAYAIQQLREHGALPLIDAGRFEDAVAKVANVWASLPGAGYGQHENKMAHLLEAYQAAGGAGTS